MSAFYKFPPTPHLLWLSGGSPRDDKVLGRGEAEEFLKNPVLVEEKVDGANLGISFDATGSLLVQNRGGYLDRGTKGQFAKVWHWLAVREERLFDVLEDRLILFGEWCYASHSIHYRRLPDWFLVFDVFDKTEQRFWNSERRDQLSRDLELVVVPRVASGRYALGSIPSLITGSTLYEGPMEGIYLRQEDRQWLTLRAKIVQAKFVQRIGEHWSKRPLVCNELATRDLGDLGTAPE